ncbi:hypothetical protein ACYATO_02945 [Lactobacillaceae bacterium Melli_B3]
MKVTTTLTAPQIEQHFDSDHYYLSGAALAYQLTGQANEGLLSLSEYLRYFDYLRVITDKPFILDGQAGFGNPLNTFHSIIEMENHGADIIMLNDQTHPSHNKKQQQTPAELNQFIGRIKAALDAHHPEYSRIWIKLDCTDQYSQDELEQRLQLLKYLGIEDIVIDQECLFDSLGMNIHHYSKATQTILD